MLAFQKPSLQWFHTLLDKHFFYYCITAIRMLKSSENLYIHTFILFVWMRGPKTERQKKREREGEKMTLLYMCFSAIHYESCACQLEIVVFWGFFLDISSSGRCGQAFSVGNKNAAMVLIVCMKRDLTAAWKGGSGSVALLCFCGLRWTYLKTLISFVPAHKSNIRTAHLTTAFMLKN